LTSVFSQNDIYQAFKNPKLEESIILMKNVHSVHSNVSDLVAKKVKDAINFKRNPLCFLEIANKKFGYVPFKKRVLSPANPNRRFRIKYADIKKKDKHSNDDVIDRTMNENLMKIFKLYMKNKEITN
jgi:hypothetical protein